MGNTTQKGHAALWSRLILHFWALEKEKSLLGSDAAAWTPDPVDYLQSAYEKTKEATGEWLGTTTSVGALLHHTGDHDSPQAKLFVTNLGDSQVMVVRPSSGEIIYKTTEQWHWFDCPRQLGNETHPTHPRQNAVVDSVDVEEGDIVLAMSDGVVGQPLGARGGRQRAG